jgi:PAS domain S-box-containing protein
MTEADGEPMGGAKGPAKQDRPAASPGTTGLEAEARHGRGAAAGRADLAASEGADEALRRADAELAANRAALREREERLRLVLDSAADYAIFTTDLDRRVSSWNAGAERLLGWSDEEVVGRSGDVIFTPEDRESGAPEGEAARALAEGRAENERWHLRKDGSRFWGSGMTMPLRDPAAAGPGAPPLGLVKVMRDRTERKRAEEELRAADEAARAEGARLRLALEAGRLGTWELDAATGAIVRSPRHDAIFGYAAPPPWWSFRRFLRHVLPADRASVARAFRAAAAGGATDLRFECRIRRADDGAERWIEGRGQPVRDADGRTVRLLGVVQDITERKRAEERRALLVNELNHRVKNTLAVVQSLAAQTARGVPDLAAFGAAFQRRILALARAHDLLTREDWTGAPLGEVVRAGLAPLALDAARVDLSVSGAADVALPPGAAVTLAMAVHELATNALKHGALSVPEGRVSIACRAAAGPGGDAQAVEWTERGGPPVAGPPARRGFGLRLLERGLAAQAGAGADLRFEPEGLRCTLRLPSPPRAALPGPRG